MATKNSIDSAIPIELAKGGTNASSFANTNGVVYYDGTRLVTTSAGTVGQVLTSNGAGSAPTYQSLSAGTGSLIYISTQTASASAAVSFTDAAITSFTNFLVVFSNVNNTDTSNSYIVGMRLSDDGGSSWKTTNYISDDHSYPDGGSLTSASSTSYFVVFDSIRGDNPAVNSGILYIFNRSTSSTGMSVCGQVAYRRSDVSANTIGFLAGMYNATITCNAFQFLITGSTMSSGTFILYGIKNS